MPKPVYQILFVFLILAFTVVACNNKKEGEKKETTVDTVTVKPIDQTQPADDTAKKMETPSDTAKKKPVKDPS